MPSPQRVIPVVCALIERDGCVLVAQRPAHKHLGLKWEFPGGKVEPGEEPAAALVREIREELGCTLIHLRPLPVSTHNYDDRVVELIPFTAQVLHGGGEPHPHEHQAVRWVRPAELREIDLAAADVPVVASYLALAGRAPEEDGPGPDQGPTRQ